jgi:hypothetical protein
MHFIISWPGYFVTLSVARLYIVGDMMNVDSW